MDTRQNSPDRAQALAQGMRHVKFNDAVWAYTKRVGLPHETIRAVCLRSCITGLREAKRVSTPIDAASAAPPMECPAPDDLFTALSENAGELGLSKEAVLDMCVEECTATLHMACEVCLPAEKLPWLVQWYVAGKFLRLPHMTCLRLLAAVEKNNPLAINEDSYGTLCNRFFRAATTFGKSRILWRDEVVNICLSASIAGLLQACQDALPPGEEPPVKEPAITGDIVVDFLEATKVLGERLMPGNSDLVLGALLTECASSTERANGQHLPAEQLASFVTTRTVAKFKRLEELAAEHST
jgi:hypothetical protein